LKPIDAALTRIADAVAAGRSAAESDLNLLKENAFELSVDNSEFWTHVLPKDSMALDLPRFNQDWSDLDDAISEVRIEELNDGAEPTREELDLLWSVVVQRLFEQPDDDVTPGLWILNLQGNAGSAIAVVACEGCSYWTRRWLLGVYPHLSAACTALEETYIFPD